MSIIGPCCLLFHHRLCISIARNLGDIKQSKNAAIPSTENCETDSKCCIYSDPEVKRSIERVTKTLKDLYATFQKSCTKCNQKLKDEAQRDEWSSWGAWGSCDVSCGQNGRRQRERQCVRLPAQERGDSCEGQAVQVARCPAMAPCQ
ncbi:hemicentin 1, partial [Plakobranchus ocellatus]